MINVDININELMQELFINGIDTRNLFYPLHKQPFLTNKLSNESFPISEDLYNRGMYVPSGSNLNKEDILYICKTIEKTFVKLN